jgi:integrase
MTGAVVIEDYSSNKKNEYIHFVGQLGAGVRFSEDRWVCDKLRRAPSENVASFTVCFSGIPEQHKEIVKCYCAISLIQGKTMGTIKHYVYYLITFFEFWSAMYKNTALHRCDEIVARMFCQHLEDRVFAESTKVGIWSAINIFFKTMNGWNDIPLKNPFSISPFQAPRKYDDKYIPESVALQLDNVFKRDEIALNLRCVYWLLRLIPSRISEIVGMRIDCLKRYNGHYVLFIPTWKQNGGRIEPIMRSIHLEETGIAGYLIELVKKQQDSAQQLQEYMPDNLKDALFTYRQVLEPKGRAPYYKQHRVSTKHRVSRAFQKICEKYNVTDDNGQIYVITPHQFRHNGVTDRLAAGFTAAQIAEMTGHHGNAMILNSYNHLNLLPETIIEKQEYVLQETDNRENRYVLFGGRILIMNESLEKRLLRNLRAHKVRGGICSDITGCKSDMWNCLDCEFFVADAEQLDYYKEQIVLWRDKSIRFSSFPIIKGNADRNAELYERVLKKLEEGTIIS